MLSKQSAYCYQSDHSIVIQLTSILLWNRSGYCPTDQHIVSLLYCFVPLYSTSVIPHQLALPVCFIYCFLTMISSHPPLVSLLNSHLEFPSSSSFVRSPDCSLIDFLPVAELQTSPTSASMKYHTYNHPYSKISLPRKIFVSRPTTQTWQFSSIVS